MSWDSDVLPELKDDGVEYPADGEALFARDVLQAQIKMENLEQHFDLDHVKDLYPFDVGSNSRSNPFEKGGDDAIQTNHGPLLHWTQAKDHVGGISEANGTLEDQNKRETKFGGQKCRKSGEITMRSQEWLFKSRTLWR
ncbi:hypothetical protein Adt_27803 [Abeliophyllum distichum]|uniref:Uncharacterized protein n=1 Tax=Abeliophyllum distichum TaxID=126358 RepID=A0ABD1RUS0_9LAMI